MSAQLTPNPMRGATPEPTPAGDATAFHRRFPDYQPTPLFDLPSIAETLGAGHFLVKDESDRLGLPAFKMLGAAWASYRALVDHLGHEPNVSLLLCAHDEILAVSLLLHRRFESA